MDSHEYLEAVGRASQCVAAHTHSPRPLRFVWHHILPQACGGLTTTDNLAELCDSCHYSIHILMYSLSQGHALHSGGKIQRDLAHQGYAAAVAAGTAELMPKESDVVIE